MNRKNFYLTTPIFYPNNKLHLGHAYTMTIADVIVRYKKMQNYNVYFQTGSDEHGEKISKTALRNNVNPQDLVDQNVILFKKLWEKLNISRDYFFMRTSSSSHKKKVQKIFKDLLLKGDIYLGKYKGNYCVSCEEYILNSKVCSFCKANLEEIEEEAFFFKISKYRRALIKYYDNNLDFLSPKAALNEIFQSFLDQKLHDLCITRHNLDWGIAVPGRPKMTIYVWFDALCNYLTSDKGESFFSNNEEPSEIVQIIGKDILRFHTIYWISLLMSLEKRFPNKIISHGWILNSGSKMSKSKGNVVDPLKTLERYKSDVLRAYFASKIPIYQDGLLNENLLSDFYQKFFLNDLGNLFSRVFKMLEIYASNTIPIFKKYESQLLSNYYEECVFSVHAYEKKMNEFQITSAFKEIEKIVENSNKLISKISPWKLNSEKNYDLLNNSLLCLINGIKIIVFLLLPFTPETSDKIISHLNIDIRKVNLENIFEFKNVENIKIKNPFFHLFNKN